MPKISCGLLMYRQLAAEVHFFLVHPGGPYFVHRDKGYWGIPKGLVEPGEDLLAAAKREFEEETGILPKPPYHSLAKIQYNSSRKIVHAWAFSGEWDPQAGIHSNRFEMEWPPNSGQYQTFPEVDQARWFNYEEAQVYIHPAQFPLLDRLRSLIPPSI